MTKSLDAWLKAENADMSLIEAVVSLGEAAARIAEIVRRAPLDGKTGVSDSTNVHGEDQKLLDLIANDIILSALADCAGVAVSVSEEVDEVISGTDAGESATLAVCFDPLDGSSNIGTNGGIGTIFSILQLEAGRDEQAVLAAVRNQAAAGYVLYGPATLLVMTTGRSVAVFALDPDTGGFHLVRSDVRIPSAASEFAINMSYRRFWPAPVTTYIDECLMGEDGPRGKRYNCRWAGAMVADVHRVIERGGIFVYPAMTTPGGANGKLRYLYEVNPMAMLMKAAGGAAIAAARSVDEVVPEGLHDRVPVALGSFEEVERLLGHMKALPG